MFRNVPFVAKPIFVGVMLMPLELILFDPAEFPSR
jgi:hypothetical protein